jgi:hypothetical protein
MFRLSYKPGVLSATFTVRLDRPDVERFAAKDGAQPLAITIPQLMACSHPLQRASSQSPHDVAVQRLCPRKCSGILSAAG